MHEHQKRIRPRKVADYGEGLTRKEFLVGGAFLFGALAYKAIGGMAQPARAEEELVGPEKVEYTQNGERFLKKPSARPVFTDNFDEPERQGTDGSDKWVLDNVRRNKWVIENGYYKYNGRVESEEDWVNTFGVYAKLPETMTDFDASMRQKLEDSGTGACGRGVYMWNSKNDNFILFEFGSSASVLRRAAWMDGEHLFYEHDFPSDGGIWGGEDGKWHTLRIVKRDTEAKFYLDNWLYKKFQHPKLRDFQCDRIGVVSDPKLQTIEKTFPKVYDGVFLEPGLRSQTLLVDDVEVGLPLYKPNPPPKTETNWGWLSVPFGLTAAAVWLISLLGKRKSKISAERKKKRVPKDEIAEAEVVEPASEET